MNNLRYRSRRRMALAIGVVCMPPAALAQHDIDEIIVTGASRPIIRGLAGARVRTMEDGIESMDVSTVSDDHSASIDPLVARQIEIFRGPTTLLYGGGAVGGIVNTVTNRTPEDVPEDGFEGAFELCGDTVADEIQMPSKACSRTATSSSLAMRSAARGSGATAFSAPP